MEKEKAKKLEKEKIENERKKKLEEKEGSRWEDDNSQVISILIFKITIQSIFLYLTFVI